jgi:long-subunit fatty acid transport protein
LGTRAGRRTPRLPVLFNPFGSGSCVNSYCSDGIPSASRSSWLTGGTNAAINGLVGSSTLVDGVPLNWKDQYSFHLGAERGLTEKASLRFGYAYGNPVPSSTLKPMTAAIMSNQISTGLVYNLGRSRLEGAYVFDPTAQSHVQQSGLFSGEYNNSTVHVGTQALTLGYSVQF